MTSLASLSRNRLAITFNARSARLRCVGSANFAVERSAWGHMAVGCAPIVPSVCSGWCAWALSGPESFGADAPGMGFTTSTSLFGAAFPASAISFDIFFAGGTAKVPPPLSTALSSAVCIGGGGFFGLRSSTLGIVCGWCPPRRWSASSSLEESGKSLNGGGRFLGGGCASPRDAGGPLNPGLFP